MKLLNKIQDFFNKFDNRVKKIMKQGMLISFIICILATISLLTYETIYPLPMLFTVGFSIFRTGLMFIVAFLICGIGFDTITKQRI